MESARSNGVTVGRLSSSGSGRARAVLLACAGVVLAASGVQAAINIPVQSGAWEDGNTWITGAPPAGTDDTYLDQGFTITSTGNNTVGGELQIGVDANAYGRGNPGGGGTLNINAGTLTVGTAAAGKSLVVGQSQPGSTNNNSGVLNIAAGATFTNYGYVLVGFFGDIGSPTTGVVNVNGGTFNSLGDSNGQFRIGGRSGNYNTGTFNVTNGGTVTTTKGVFLGGASNAALNISGAGSSFTTSQFISIGTDSDNPTATQNLNISGGTLACRELSICEGRPGTSTLTQTGGSIILDQTGGNTDFQIGRSTNTASSLGVYNMSGGTLLVNRGNLLVASGNNGTFGISGNSNVTIGAGKSIILNTNNRTGATANITQTGGTVNLPADSASGVSFSSVGVNTYNLNGGVLTTPKITATAGAGTRAMNFAGGTLVANGAIAAANLTSTFGTGGGTINTNGNSVTWDVATSGGGGLNKTGAGALILPSANTYGGTTTVSGGSLYVNNTSGSGTGAGPVQVTAGLLGGSGAISGATSILGSTLGPGASVGAAGTLSLGSSLSLSGTSTAFMDLASASSFDHVNVAGALTYGGTLEVNVASGYVPTSGSTYDLFDSTSTSGAFSSILVDNSSLTASFNPATGVLTLSSVPEPTSIGLAMLGGLGLASKRRRRAV